MEPDRFDDVELQVFEEPAPRDPRRASRWALAIVASVLTAGALAAGASALTGSGGEPARPVAKQQLPRLQGDAAWHAVRPCSEHHAAAASAPMD
jgi:hypothetical protein